MNKASCLSKRDETGFCVNQNVLDVIPEPSPAPTINSIKCSEQTCATSCLPSAQKPLPSKEKKCGGHR